MLWLYSFILWFLYNTVRFFPFKNNKITLFCSGRKNWTLNLLTWKKKCGERPIIWMHVASLGEFYQGIPVFERIYKEYNTKYSYLITFFSPSGYEIIKNKESFYTTYYLPVDTRYNAKRFLNIVCPHLVIFVKYEFWPNFLFQIKRKNINCILIAALFRNTQPFFNWYGFMFKKMLKTFSRIYVQNEFSYHLLKNIGIDCNIFGDPRIDDTLQRKNNVKEITLIKKFKDKKNTVIIGSCWHEDLDVILEPLIHFLEKNTKWKIIITPHDYSNSYESRIKKQIKDTDLNVVKYTQLSEKCMNCEILIIDTVGVLFSSYQYGDIVIIGGGFGVGLHNILEPSAFQLPILFGNKTYEKFQEAIDLVGLKSVFLISNSKDCYKTIAKLVDDKSLRQDCGDKNYKYMLTSQGVSEKILLNIKYMLN